MRIEKSRINSIKNIITIADGKKIKVSSSTENLENLRKIGFKKLEIGESIVPNIFGPVTKFNKNGKEIIDNTKTETVSHILPYNVIDWHGTHHSGTYVRKFKRYKHVNIEAPLIRITLTKIIDGKYIVSSELLNSKDSNEKIKTTINILLELFRKVEIIDENDIPLLLHKSVPWKILPPGQYPWEIFKNHINIVRRKISDEEYEDLKERYTFIKSLAPIEIFTGTDGLLGYYIAKFNDNLYVCDSIYYGNAIYVLGNNWENVSKLTKREIIKKGLYKDRILHKSNWKSNLLKVINN